MSADQAARRIASRRRAAKSLALLAVIDRQPSQQDDGNEVVAQPLGDARRGIVAADGTGGQGITSDNAILPDCHIGTRRLAPMVRPRMLVKVVVEGGTSAVEGSEVVFFAQAERG